MTHAAVTHREPIILIIDDEAAILKTLKDSLSEESFFVETLQDPKKAIDIIGSLVPDLVLLDIFMPNVNGLDLLTRIKKEYPMQKVMVISGFGTIAMAVDAVRLGALDFIEKPLNLDDILEKLSFLHTQQTHHVIGAATKKDTYETYGIIGQSYLFGELMHAVNQVAPLDLPLLIYGEHGVGKTLIARYVHYKKGLHDDTFFMFDCQHANSIALLVHHVTHVGQGTVYIKHIHTLSSDLQKSLLEVLRTVGHNRIRFIASSCVSLYQLTMQHGFNASLFHFFNVIPLEIPVLNKRRYDIPLLAHHFIQHENHQQHKQVTFDAGSMRMLRNMDFVGNVTQLQLLIKTIIACVPEGLNVVTPDVMEQYLRQDAAWCVEEQRFTRFSSLEDAKLAFEKQFLLHMLKKNRYDLEQVSDCLRLDISQLRDRMLALQIAYKG